MEEEPIGHRFNNALQEFHRARLRGDLEQLRARLTGRSAELLSYEEVRRMLHAGSPIGKRELRDVPLSAIVGSVGRYKDFTRSFLPLQDGTASRWANLQIQAAGMHGFPAIELYQIGDAYFVQDGNHRISVARQMGAKQIEAYVTKIETRVPLSPEDDLDDLIIKAEYADFLAVTKLDQIRPHHNLTVTTPGRYPLLMTQIEAHRQQLSEETGRQVSMSEASAHWYDTVYLPTVDVIRRREMLRDFPNRTETDLYAWIHKYREDLIDALDWELDPETVAMNLPQHFSPRPEHRMARWGERLRTALIPNALEAGPAPGEWRRTRGTVMSEGPLFRNVLVPIGFQESDWAAIEQAITVAKREDSTIYGLHIVDKKADLESDRIRSFRTRFEEACHVAKVHGELMVIVGETEIGSVVAAIAERARWVDLITVRVDRPPSDQPLARLGSSIAMLLRRSPRPVLTVPEHKHPLRNAILAYDGSPKANEALFVAAYLAARWKLMLTVVSVLESGRVADETIAQAKAQLDAHSVNAEFIVSRGEVASTLLDTAANHGSDLIIMGGYGFNPLLEVVLGSTVDEILRTAEIPVLICR
jgi:nucleotide-binding universal stress UspA family protein